MGWQPVNTGSGASALFLRKNHTFRHPASGSDIRKQKYGSTPNLDRTKISTLPLPCLSPAAAGHGRSNSTNRSKAQSPCIPRTGLRRPLYVGSPKESSDVAPSLRTAVASGEIDVKAHQILAHRTSRMPRRIPPSEQEMPDRQVHDR
jgi:hypothetical protein